MTGNLPFTLDQFFDVFARYNRALWPFAVALWLYAAAAAVALARRRAGSNTFIATMLGVQWAWAGVVYHWVFFTAINPAAWLFGALFAFESAVLVWFGVVHGELEFAPTGSIRHVLAWTLIGYALLYPALVALEGYSLPRAPSFGVPCPTTLLTAGFLLAVNTPWPRAVAFVPIAWAVVGGSAALLFGVRTDLMLWFAAVALTAVMFVPARRSVRV